MDREIAYAKINLALHVRRRRDDGYHDLETLFAFCADGDVVEAEEADDLSLSITGPFADGLSTEDNLVLRAATALGHGKGANIHLIKNLPVASGIGGGSADAAATLRLLSRLWGVDVDLHAIAADLGADVPACIESTAAVGRGRGDALESHDGNHRGLPILLVNPGIPLHTGDVFAAWDGIDHGPIDVECRFGRNDLETAAVRLVREISEVLAALGQSGATFRQMSGSGATCFALYQSDRARDDAARVIADAHPTWWTMVSNLR
jgi:4-diphosphocytidyl-2-C-methyl-D-erythritol kinase